MCTKKQITLLLVLLQVIIKAKKAVAHAQRALPLFWLFTDFINDFEILKQM